MTPWCSAGAPTRGPRMSRPPMPSRAASKPTIAGQREGRVASRAGAGIVMTSRTRPTAVSARPHHCRLPTSKPKRRSAITAMSTTPPESTTWTTDSGASEIAATWRVQAPAADDHADGEPARGVQRLGRAQRMAHVDGRSLASTAVLEEEAQVGSDGAEQRQQDAELKCHDRVSSGRVESTWRVPSR